MILADASVVIVYERVPTPRLKKVIADADAAVCGLTIAELFAGVRSAKDEAKLQTALYDFRSLSISDTVWEGIGRNQSHLSARGVTVPLIDTALATIAMDDDIETLDL
jgi:predicted nucleic acid-binding protein